MLRKKSPISERQQELEAREEAIRREMDRLQRLIEEAPEREKEERIRRRQELVEEAARGGRLDIPNSLRPRELNVDASRGSPPRLKVEHKAQRIRFITLFIILSILMILLLSKLSEAI